MLQRFFTLIYRTIKFTFLCVFKWTVTKAYSGSDLETLLLQAVEEKSDRKVWWCAQAGANVNCRNPDGLTPLFFTALRPRFTLPGGNFTAPPVPMEKVDAHCRARIARSLIEAGADLNSLTLFEAEYSHYLTALQTAVYSHNDDVINVLLDYGADVNAISRGNGFTALHCAVDDVFCSIDTVKKLLQVPDLQINVSCRQYGNTALHLAVLNEKKCVELVDLLLKHGADVNKKNRAGMNAVQDYLSKAISLRTRNWCFRGIDPELLKLLPPSESDTSRLHVACMFHRTDEVRKLASELTDRNEINARDTFGHSPMFYAIMSRGPITEKVSTVRLLLSLGVDVNQEFGRYHCPEEGNYSILDIAILLGDRNISYVLMQYVAKYVELSSVDEERALKHFNLDLVYWSDGEQGMSNLWLYYVDCRDELRSMKKSKVGESQVSFFDLLTADAKRSAAYARNKKLVEAFEAGMRDVFPIHQESILYTNFGRLVEHKRLAERAADLLSDALRFADSTDLFFEKTLSYFDNEDLRFLLDSSS